MNFSQAYNLSLSAVQAQQNVAFEVSIGVIRECSLEIVEWEWQPVTGNIYQALSSQVTFMFYCLQSIQKSYKVGINNNNWDLITSRVKI